MDQRGAQPEAANRRGKRFSPNGPRGCGVGAYAALIVDLGRGPAPTLDLEGLRDAGVTLHVAASVADAAAVLAVHPVVAGLVHLGSGATDEERLLSDIEALAERAPALRLIALVDEGVERPRLLASLVRRGLLYDYHTLPADTARLLVTLGHVRGLVELERLAASAGAADSAPAAEFQLIGAAPALRAVRDAIGKVAADDAPVLITGESGTGKELAAREIHARSPFRGGPFVAVNCAALPPNLVASELFGHEKGAFTSAHQRKIGQIEAAKGGTLFLDEIGDLPLDVQGHLLRFLQDKTIQRVGSTQTITVDVRIISATHVDCTRAIREGRFREDLYYRLNVLRIHMPALRERAEDIPAIAEFYLKKFVREHRRRVQGFQPGARAAMQAYAWPGNVRELVSAVRRAVVMADGRWITAADLGLPADGEAGAAAAAAVPPLEETRSEAEAAAIRRALELSNYNIRSAARALGVSRVTLYRLIEKHAIKTANGHAGGGANGQGRDAEPAKTRGGRPRGDDDDRPTWRGGAERQTGRARGALS